MSGVEFLQRLEIQEDHAAVRQAYEADLKSLLDESSSLPEELRVRIPGLLASM